MRKYLNMLSDILNNGTDKGDRTGTGTRSIFGYQLRFNLQDGFPILTTKKIHLRSIIYELLWFLKGDTNIKYLQENGVKIWNEWADENGELGPVYGKQWRDFGGMDQIAWVEKRIKTDPDCRRMIVSAWNPPEIEKMKIPPCHCLFQFNVTDGKLNCQLYQRSCDAFLGVPFNITSYALLTCMMAKVTGLEPGEFIHTYGDLHIYSNHFKQVEEQLSREPKKLPVMLMNNRKNSIFGFDYYDFHLDGYDPLPGIKAPIAV